MPVPPDDIFSATPNACFSKKHFIEELIGDQIFTAEENYYLEKPNKNGYGSFSTNFMNRVALVIVSTCDLD